MAPLFRELSDNNQIEAIKILFIYSFLSIAGHLIRGSNGRYRVQFDEKPLELQSYFSEKGRGLELSELQVFDGLKRNFPFVVSCMA